MAMEDVNGCDEVGISDANVEDLNAAKCERMLSKIV